MAQQTGLSKSRSHGSDVTDGGMIAGLGHSELSCRTVIYIVKAFGGVDGLLGRLF
jgi:hypothetical protein